MPIEEARICCEDISVTKVREEIYPDDPSPCVVEVSCVVETYPIDPRPATVEVIFRVNCSVDTKEADPRPVTVEASSTGSMKLVM